MTIAILVFLVIVALIILSSIVSIYNGLISLKNQVDRAWPNIDIILKQRYDEIPQLVQILEQMAQYEKSVIQKVMDARTRYGSASSTSEKISASQEMSFALKGIFAIGENYPELKSNNNFVHLQTRLSALESQLADRRELYNDSVTNFNTRIEQFPDVILAGMLQYRARDLFQVAASDKAMPNLKNESRSIILSVTGQW